MIIKTKVYDGSWEELKIDCQPEELKDRIKVEMYKGQPLFCVSTEGDFVDHICTAIELCQVSKWEVFVAKIKSIFKRNELHVQTTPIPTGN